MTGYEYMLATSGYRSCSCLDCMDVTVASYADELCGLCEESGCEPLGYCQRDDLYEEC